MRPEREGRLHHRPPPLPAMPWLLNTDATYIFSIGLVHTRIGAGAL
jgi:hypothetical protein